MKTFGLLCALLIAGPVQAASWADNGCAVVLAEEKGGYVYIAKDGVETKCTVKEWIEPKKVAQLQCGEGGGPVVRFVDSDTILLDYEAVLMRVGSKAYPWVCD